MIKGTGIDIIEVARLKKMVEKGNRFIEKVFTPSEIEYCRGKYRQEIHFAARFAAKEAFFKALGTGWRDGMAWTEISVVNDPLGKPEIILSGKTLEYFKKNNCRNLHLSISHTKEYAVASVIIED